FFPGGLGEHYDLVETPPQGRVEKALVVRRRQGQRLEPETIEHLEEGVHNTFQFPVLVGGRAVLADGVKLVEEQDQRPASGEIKDLSQIGGRLAKVRRHDSVKSYRPKWQVKLVSQSFRGNRFTAPGRSAEQDLAYWANAVGP